MTRLFNEPSAFADEMIERFVASHGRWVKRVSGGVVRNTKRTPDTVALVIRGPSVAQELTRQIEATLAQAAYRVEQRQGKLHWAAPKGADFGDESKEPGASTKLRLMVRLVAPFAPDEML